MGKFKWISRKKYYQKRKDFLSFQNKNKWTNHSKIIPRFKIYSSNHQSNKKEGEGLKKMKINKIICKMLNMYLKAKTCRTCNYHSKILSMKTQKIYKIAFIKMILFNMMFLISQMIQKKPEL